MKKIIHELLILLCILLVSFPLALGLRQVLQLVDVLKAAFKQVLPEHNYSFVLLYCLVVVGCYLIRLAVFGSNLLLTKVPEDF